MSKEEAVKFAQMAANRTGQRMGVYQLPLAWTWSSESWIAGGSYEVEVWVDPLPESLIKGLKQAKEGKLTDGLGRLFA